MVNQKSISAKLDYSVADMLEQEAFVSGVSKNRILNKAIKHYTEYRDAERLLRCGNGTASVPADAVATDLGKYILNTLTKKQHEDAYFIAKGYGCSLQHLFFSFISYGIEDVKKRPFSYL